MQLSLLQSNTKWNLVMKINATERAMKDVIRILAILRKLGVFNKEDLYITTSNIKGIVHRWKGKIYADKLRS